MKEPKEFYRDAHPEQFSDSVTIQVGNLSREFFDYYLESITSRSQEKQFEDFCRHIVEVEVCPNLLPQTGPTGGGDSKVDSETYPVAEQLALTWYYGEGNRAATERWAFAISAKKDWLSKIKSDVAKIVEVNQSEQRGYAKVFFMSNQYIPDKKRSEVEASLHDQYGIDIRILDRTWLLDKSLNNRTNIEIAIKSFALSASFADTIKTGELDYKRKQEIGDIEERLRDQNIKSSEMVLLAQRSVTLARELEYSESQIFGLIERSIRLAKELGTTLDVANAWYNAAWTMIWWYSNYSKYYEFYKEFEKLAISEKKVSLFSDLVTLWTNLFTISCETDEIKIDTHTAILLEMYKQFTSDPNKPNTLIEAKSSYQLVRYFLGDDPADIVNDMIDILDNSNWHIDLDISPICRAVQELPIFEDVARYDELFERTVDYMSKQKQQTQAALMLAKRGRMLKKDKPYEALSYFSRTLFMFFNEANKNHLISVIMDIGDLLQNVGLIWASRNFYYYDFCLCLNQYTKYGEVSPFLFMSADALKLIEIELGHVLHAVGFHELSMIAKNLYPGEINENEKYADAFDYFVARQIVRSAYETEKSLCQLPDFLEKHELFLSCVAMKYELGYYDETMMANLGNNQDAFDDFIKKLAAQPVSDCLYFAPWYGLEHEHLLQAKVLGCSITVKIHFPYEHGEIEIGASILATVESFLATGVSNSLISLCGKIDFELEYDESCDVLIKYERLETMPNYIKVVFRDYDPEIIISEQTDFSDFLVKLLSIVISLMFPVNSEFEKVKKMSLNDAAFERASAFANSVFIGMETLGKSSFSRSSLMSNYESIQPLRNCKSVLTTTQDAEIESIIPDPLKVSYAPPPEDFDIKNINNKDIHTFSLINIVLWDKAQWKGVMYIEHPLHAFPPILSLIFLSPFGNAIFDEWVKDIGSYDKENKIGIRIIKGVDKDHPFWYRVAIGPLVHSGNHSGNHKVYFMASRMHTMEPNNSINLDMFERELELMGSYSICSSYAQNLTSPIEIYENGVIRKNRDSILICNAYEIPENDTLAISAIHPNDNLIIPPGKEDSPIVKIIDQKKQHSRETD